MKWFFTILMMLSASTQAASIESKGSIHLKEAVEEALLSLPDEYLATVKKVVSIEESSLKTDTLFKAPDLCQMDEGVKFGFTFKNKITISKKLIQLAQENTQVFNCGHKTFRNMLKAVIIHELTHIKDNQEKISTDPDFQRIVGMKKVKGNSKLKVTNQNAAVSPDAYEYKNLEESLAVNVEYLVLDPEFECRRPATAGFLSKKLGIALKGECNKNYKVLAQSAYIEDNYQLSVNIDPKRIYQIHYLFAGKGQALMSRWGHAMFRLVVCAPHRKKVGPECIQDVSHHLALSYRAAMSDLNISYAKGVFGGYPSQLFILRYLEVQQEYTKFELRDLFSVPLKVTASQKQEFIDLTLERFWTYQGKYYFLDNNCGTETVKHLAVALSEDESKLIGSITPLKIYRDIIKHSNDLSAENFESLSREEMVERNLLVTSMFSSLDESYQFLKSYFPSFKEKSFKKYLKSTKALARAKDYQDFIDGSKNMNPVLRKQVGMKMVHLERYLASRFIMEVPKKAMELMNKDKALKAEVIKMGDTLKLLTLQPWQIINSHYGVPTASEFEAQFPKFIEKRKLDIKMSIENQMEQLAIILGKKYFEKELHEIEELKRIKKMTSEFINEVNTIKQD